MSPVNADAMLLRNKAYSQFVEQLLKGAMRPGLFLSQRDLVARIGQPLGAIREMVLRLEQEGLLTIVPQRGMQIPHIDLHLVRDAYQFRLFLEREAIAEFTTTASDADLTSLRREHESILADAERDGQSPEIERRAEAADWGLHDQVIDSLGNRIISDAYRINSIKIRIIARERTHMHGRVVPAMREHIALISAMEHRDVQATVQLLTQHIATSRDLALRP
jgi:DNA-binding GntR family transcriptional regulator